MNIPIIGRIYHVVDKTTGEVVKVGSTIQTLKWRFYGRDYKTKYTNHFLREVRAIQSSELDWYEKGNPYCPFLWHLVAAEHLEIIKQRTFKNGKLSNRISPLVQKYSGFDGCVAGRFGGAISGQQAAENGSLEKARNSPAAKEARKKLREQGHMKWVQNLPQTKKAQSENGHIVGLIYGPINGLRNAQSGRMSEVGKKYGPINGRKLADSGELKKIGAKGSKAAGLKARESGQIKALGLLQGQRNVENGHISALGRKQGRKLAESGHCARISELGNHVRVHVNLSRVNPRCILCSEQSLIVAFA